jgi:uncharacterized membrane protein
VSGAAADAHAADPPSPERRRRAPGSGLTGLAVGLLLLIGLLLVPDLTPTDLTPTVGQTNVRAVVVREAGTDERGIPAYEVDILEGPDAGARLTASAESLAGPVPGGSVQGGYRPGDEVVVATFTGPAGGFSVIAEPWRLPVLGLLLGAFAAAVVVVGGMRGLRSLVALGLTLGVIVKLVVPLFLRGWDPVLVAVGVAAAVTIATLAITEGLGRVTVAAVLGTLTALLLTAGLAAVFNAAAAFTAVQGNEEIAFLIPIVGERVDLQGILLAATVFGALGVIDDVTVTQAAAVEQLHAAEPTGGRALVVRRAMRVGRSHIAATVNTLVLAYLGAGLPLLLLFSLSGQAPAMVLNGELLAVEVIRALVGSIGIVAAVPLTTLVAAILIVPRRP